MIKIMFIFLCSTFYFHNSQAQMDNGLVTCSGQFQMLCPSGNFSSDSIHKKLRISDKPSVKVISAFLIDAQQINSSAKIIFWRSSEL